MHAETHAVDRSAVRWVVPDSHLPCGRLVAAPGALGALLDSGILVQVTTEPHGLTMRLGSGRDWRTEGEAVRGALIAALDDVAGWVVDVDEDGVLRQIADEVLAGPVGDYVRSHGGLVTVVNAADAVLDVAFDGACSHCPASEVTLHSRLETAIRERYPDLRELRDVAACRPNRTPTLWPRLRSRT